MSKFWFKGILLIILFNLLFYILQVEYRYRYLVIHHTASSRDNYQSIKDYHKRKKHWKEAAYHLILSNGSTEVPEGYLESTLRYRLLVWSTATRSIIHNLFGIHLVIVGNYEQQKLPEALQKSLVSTLLKLQDKFHINTDNILFHRDCNSTACPGKYITKSKLKYWMYRWKNRIPEAIDLQHQAVLKKNQYHWINIKRIIPFWYSLNLVLFFIIWLVSKRRLNFT